MNSEALRNFWNLSFETPTGQALSMASLRGKPLLVNFWATWCPPCIEELPLLDSFYRATHGKGWQVIGLAVDQPSAVQKWLLSKPLSFPVGMAGFQGTELVKSFGNTTGSLPFNALRDMETGFLLGCMARFFPDLASCQVPIFSTLSSPLPGLEARRPT